MADEYVVPFGLDANPFNAGIDAMIAKAQEAEKAAAVSNERITESFKKGVSAIQAQEKALLTNSKAFTLLDNNMKVIGSTTRVMGTESTKLGQIWEKVTGIFKSGTDRIKISFSDITENHVKHLGREISTTFVKGGDIVEEFADKTGNLQNPLSSVKNIIGSGAGAGAGGIIGSLAGMALGFGAVALAGLAIKGIISLLESMGDTLSDSEKLALEIQTKAIDGYVKERVELELLTIEVQDNATTSERRLQILSDLQDKYPEYFGNMQTETDLLNGITEATDAAIRAMAFRAEKQEAVNLLVEAEGELLKAQQKPASEYLNLAERIFAINVDQTGEENKQAAVKKLTDTYNLNRDALKDIETSARNAGVDISGLGDAMQKAKKDTETLTAQLADLDIALIKDDKTRRKAEIFHRSELQKQQVEKSAGDATIKNLLINAINQKAVQDSEKIDKEYTDKAVNEQKKRHDKIVSQQEKHQNKALQVEKKTNDFLFKLTEEAAKVEASLIEDEYTRRDELIKQGANKQINTIKKQVAEQITELKKLGKTGEIAKLTEVSNGLIEDLEKKSTQDRLELYKQFVEKRLRQERDLENERISLMEDGKEKTLATIEQRYQAELDKIDKLIPKAKNKAQELIKIFLQAQAGTNRDVAINKVNTDEEKKILDHQHSFNKRLIEVQFAFGKDMVHIEEYKNFLLLKEDLRYEEEKLKRIRTTGTQAEIDAQLDRVNAVSKAVSEAKKTKDVGSVGLGKLLGFDDEGSAEFAEIFDKSLELVKNFADAYIGLLDMQMAKKQELIDMENERIEELEDQLEREQSLADKGLANNVKAVTQELALKKAARDKDIADQKRLLKQKEDLQKAELLLDSITQVSDLISASTQIFKQFSKIPYVGVPLAIAMIATMFGAFAVAKVTAFNAISKKAEGGWVEGESHDNGGRKYIAQDGSGVMELEGTEYVVKKKSARKYKNVVEALNKDDFSTVSIDDTGFRNMLKGMGISLEDDTVKKSVNQATEAYNTQAIIINNSGHSDKYLRSIDQSTKFLAEKEMNKEETLYEDENVRIVKQGNTTRKINKT